MFEALRLSSHSRPFHWFGVAVAVLGVLFGGLLGGAVGIMCYFSIVAVGKQSFSQQKKIILSSLITAGDLYFTLYCKR